jgi:hypothetical protein
MHLRGSAAALCAVLLSTSPSPALGQIVDRPPAQPRPQSYWGVRVSVAPQWWTPDAWGKLFFENVDPARKFTMEGMDWSIGVVRARPLGIEFGVSMTKKTISQD